MYACIKSGNTIIYDNTDTANANSLSLYSSTINSAMKFRELPVGNYTYVVAGNVRDYYVGYLSNHNNLYSITQRVNVIEANFTVTSNGTPVPDSVVYFDNNKEATEAYMVVMNGDATLYTTPDESGPIASLQVNGKTMSVVPRYYVVYADYLGCNSNGEYYYHLANRSGFVCDQLNGTYVKANLLTDLEVGRYVVCPFSGSGHLSIRSAAEIDSNNILLNLSPGASFYYTGELVYGYDTEVNKYGSFGSVRVENTTGWAKVGYFVYDSTHTHTYGSAIYADDSRHLSTCTDCGYMSYSNHYIVEDSAVSATCTSTGLTAGSHCSVCDGIIVAQEITPALDHNYGAPTWTWTGVTSATAKFVLMILPIFRM